MLTSNYAQNNARSGPRKMTVGKIKVESLLLFLVFILNYWTYQLFQQDILLGFILSIITVTLFTVTFVKVDLIYKIAILLLLIFICVGSFYLLSGHFDTTLGQITSTETKTISLRHGYFAQGLGILFINKFSQQYYSKWYTPISHYLRNISYSIDPNLYFFKSHPREKSGIDEYDKYSPLLLPFFILGFLTHFLSLNSHKILSIYLVTAVFITGFISPYYNLGPVLLFPYLNLAILIGSLQLFDYIKHKYET
jgi:hypothetical protein